ncbi:AAA family ATPase [Aneurinibacillus danicus]|jgi:predicted ATPase|uniref:AAA domain-containing protein n=1 Tax=Aneurinibacillus danicus TaxID=267746 RepID=A0A511V816_9BACL|nr:DUF3696 domain-containing protein [Aneurinibacillus danicus]GEN35077.1 hypothetical protein ADA01nite_25370 [Aneurinibacillus danicus]
MIVRSIAVSNFKSFSEEVKLPLKGLNVLTGINSTGKTTLLQALLLLKQTFEEKHPQLMLDGPYVSLGSFKEIVYNYDIDKEITFTLEISYDLQEQNYKHSFINRIHKFVNRITSEPRRVDLLLSFGFKEIQDEICVSTYKVTYKIHTKSGRCVKSKLKVKRLSSGKYDITIENEPEEIKNANRFSEKNFSNCEVEFSGLFPIEFHGIFRGYTGNYGQIPSFYSHAVSDLIAYALQQVSYIGPLRGEPQRLYQYTNVPKQMDRSGHYAAYFFNKEKNKPITYFTSPTAEQKEGTLAEAVNHWLSEQFKITQEANTDQLHEKVLHVYLTAGTESELPVNLAGVGFGIGQLLPIIVEGLRLPQGSLFIIEQPEVHLHPYAQSVLGDFMLCLARKGVSVIVETHSDHMIHRLRRRIVEDAQGKMQEQIGMFFVVNPGGKGAKLQELIIDELGIIQNWPPGFFDQSEKELKELFKAQMERRRRG